jgi:hypothetical protein
LYFFICITKLPVLTGESIHIARGGRSNRKQFSPGNGYTAACCAPYYGQKSWKNGEVLTGSRVTDIF